MAAALIAVMSRLDEVETTPIGAPVALGSGAASMMSQSRESWGMAAGAATARPARETRTKERMLKDNVGDCGDREAGCCFAGLDDGE